MIAQHGHERDRRVVPRRLVDGGFPTDGDEIEDGAGARSLVSRDDKSAVGVRVGLRQPRRCVPAGRPKAHRGPRDGSAACLDLSLNAHGSGGRARYPSEQSECHQQDEQAAFLISEHLGSPSENWPHIYPALLGTIKLGNSLCEIGKGVSATEFGRTSPQREPISASKEMTVMTPAARQIVFINTAHAITHYSLLILPTAVLAMAIPGGPFGESYGPILALATGMFVLYGLLSLPQGWLAQRFGRKMLMTAFFLGTGVSLTAAGFVDSPLMLAAALAATGGFAAIYHPIGTTMLVEAAGDKPGRAIGVNGVFGNLGVALAPVITAFLASELGWRAAFVVPGLLCAVAGLFWARTPLARVSLHAGARPFPPIPRHLVRRAVLVLMLIAMSSGLVFNAFTLLLPKLLQERLAGNTSLLPLVGAAAFLVTLCGALTQFSVGRMIDRTTLKRVFLPISIVLTPAMAALSFAQGWPVLPLGGAVAAAIFGQVTVNETMAARYISPALRARIYSVRFFIGFLGAAAAAPIVSVLHERTGSLAAVTMVLSAFSVVTLGCALFFPNRREELE